MSREVVMKEVFELGAGESVTVTGITGPVEIRAVEAIA